jgi:hypothetical protein
MERFGPWEVAGPVSNDAVLPGEQLVRLLEQRQQVERVRRAGPVGLCAAFGHEGVKEPLDRQPAEFVRLVLQD